MKQGIIIKQIDNARSRALQWSRKMEKCPFTGYWFYLAHIFNALSKLGFEFSVSKRWDTEYKYEFFGIIIAYWRGYGKGTMRYEATLKETSSPSVNIDSLTCCINEACDELEAIVKENDQMPFFNNE